MTRADATTENTQDRTRKPSCWAFTEADWKNLVVGVIGGLLVVMIVALALILNRHLGHLKGTAAFYLAICGGPTVLLILSVVIKGVRLSERFLISGCFGHAARLRRSMVSSS